MSHHHEEDGPIIRDDFEKRVLIVTGENVIGPPVINHDYVGTVAVESIRDVTDSIAVLLTQKRQDYGTENLDKFGEFGILVRISDKVERLRNLLASGKEPNFESIDDTWRDVAGYAVLALEMKQRKENK